MADGKGGRGAGRGAGGSVVQTNAVPGTNGSGRTLQEGAVRELWRDLRPSGFNDAVRQFAPEATLVTDGYNAVPDLLLDSRDMDDTMATVGGDLQTLVSRLYVARQMLGAEGERYNGETAGGTLPAGGFSASLTGGPERDPIRITVREAGGYYRATVDAAGSPYRATLSTLEQAGGWVQGKARGVIDRTFRANEVYARDAYRRHAQVATSQLLRDGVASGTGPRRQTWAVAIHRAPDGRGWQVKSEVYNPTVDRNSPFAASTESFRSARDAMYTAALRATKLEGRTAAAHYAASVPGVTVTRR